MAHLLPGERIDEEFIRKVSSSLRNGALCQKLSEKMKKNRNEGKAPAFTNLRAGVGLKALGELSAVLEIWPVGHGSAKHQHGGCAGSVRILHGALNLKLYADLWATEPIRWKSGDAGLALPQGTNSLSIKAGQTTWMNRANWYCHQIESTPDDDTGFALSLHVYRSCTDEFAFISEVDCVAQKSNPANDFFWNIDLPADDERVPEVSIRGLHDLIGALEPSGRDLSAEEFDHTCCPSRKARS